MGLDCGLDSRLESLLVLIVLRSGLGRGVGGLRVFLAIALIRGHCFGLKKQVQCPFGSAFEAQKALFQKSSNKFCVW